MEEHDEGAEKSLKARREQIQNLQQQLLVIRQQQNDYTALHDRPNVRLASTIRSLEGDYEEHTQDPDFVDAWFDVELSNIGAKLSFDNVSGAGLGDGMDLSFDDLNLEFNDIGGGVYDAHINLTNLMFNAVKCEDGQTASTSFEVGQIHAFGELDKLFPGGRIALNGGVRAEMENPIKGSLLAQTTVHGFTLVSQGRPGELNATSSNVAPCLGCRGIAPVGSGERRCHASSEF